MLDRDDTSIRKTAAVTRPVDVVDYRCVDVAPAQEVRVQRVRHPAFDRVLGRRQRLPQHLATKHLGAADVATVATENVVLNTLEREQRDEVFEHRMHGL